MDKQAAAVRDLIVDYKRTFQTEAGQKVLSNLLTTYHIMRGTVDKECNPNAMLYKEGQRSVIVHILNQLEFDIDKFDKHIKELRGN